MKKSKIDFNDIINIKFLFKNRKYSDYQSHRIWVNNNKEHMTEYFKKYNKEHNIKEKIAGFCNICNIQTSNLSQHKSTLKHKNKII